MKDFKYKAIYMAKRKVVDAKSDKNGTITHIKLEGNKHFTSKEKIIEMAKKDKVDLVLVNDNHVRTRPDKRKGNNLNEMASN